MLRVPSSLPDDFEKLVHDTIGCCIAVNRALGPDLLEDMYSPALRLELTAAGIVFERKSPAPWCIAQLLNYMRVANKRVGLLVNFNVVILKDGLTRKVL